MWISLRVLPTLVDRLQAIAVGIENVSCVIAGIVIQARAGLAVINRAGLHRRVVERIHLGLALGDKADMCRPGVRFALFQPEENATVSSKALEVGMSFGAILTVVIEGMHDTERLQSRLVKSDRAIEIFDGYDDVVEQDSEYTGFRLRTRWCALGRDGLAKLRFSLSSAGVVRYVGWSTRVHN
jgi:hypothetical protein